MDRQGNLMGGMRLSLYQKLVISFSLSFCAIIIGFGSLILYNNGQRYQEQSFSYCRRIVQANIRFTDNYFQQLINVVQIIASDADILNAVSYRTKNPDVDYAVELYNQRRVASKIQQIDVLGDVNSSIIVGPDGKYLYYHGASPVQDYNFDEQPWFTRAADTNRLVFLNYHPTDYLLNAQQDETVSLVMPIWNSNQYFVSQPAYLLCDFSLSPVLLAPGRDDEVQLAVFDSDEAVYLSPRLELSDDQLTEVYAALNADKTSFLIEGRPGTTAYLVVAETSALSGWHILGFMPLNSIQALSSENRVFVLGLMVASFLVILIISSLLAKSVLVPVDLLIQKLNRIGRGEKGVKFEKTSSVEVDRIAETIRQMLEKNDQLTEKILEESQQRVQAQMRALQHQINPHFLNNVLHSMKALAVCGDTESISKATTLLGKLLTYSVYDPYDMVPLAREFEYIETYVALQNIRFCNRIVCTFDLTEECAAVPVPKLIIQPLVENAIEHGMLAAEGGHIFLSANREDEELYVTVTNTGRCIRPEDVARLNRMLRQGSPDAQSHSIGMLNVLARLRSSFGSGADLCVMSRDGMNTSIVITIPL